MPHHHYGNRTNVVLRVFLDDVEQRDVVECHTDEGWLVRLVRGQDGNLVLNATRDAIVTERLTGSVRVEPKS